MAHISKWDRKSKKIIDNSLENVYNQTKEVERNRERSTKTDSVYKERIKEALAKIPSYKREEIGNQLQMESSSRPMVGKTQYVKEFKGKIFNEPDVLPGLKGKCRIPMEIINDEYASRKIK